MLLDMEMNLPGFRIMVYKNEEQCEVLFVKQVFKVEVYGDVGSNHSC